jgi:hypothetical protein
MTPLITVQSHQISIANHQKSDFGKVFIFFSKSIPKISHALRLNKQANSAGGFRDKKENIKKLAYQGSGGRREP